MTPVIPGLNDFPLGMATKLRSADPALLERAVGDLIEPRHIEVCSARQRADIRISHVTTSLGHLFGVQHGIPVHATTAVPIRSYQIMVPLRGRLVGRTRDGEFSCEPGMALVYSPRDRLDTYWSEDCLSLVLSVPEEKFRRVAQASSPATGASAPRLKPLMSLWEGGGRSFANALGVICQECLDPRSAFSCGVTTRSLEATLFLSLLLSQQGDAAPPPAPSTASRQHCLQRALDLMEARCGEDIDMGDLVDVSGASSRTLQYAFMERFGVGPMTYLKHLRLRRVHADLLAARAGSCTVGDVAARWGFYNGSTFARAYHRMFGELPSRTLAAPAP